MAEGEVAAADVRLLRHRPFALYFLGRGFSRFAAQMATVALGWQVYAMTGSAFHLGLIGLAQFLPVLLLVFIAGHAAARWNWPLGATPVRSAAVAGDSKAVATPRQATAA